MSYHRRTFNKENEDRLSSFGQRLQSLSETFYSTILEDKKLVIKNAQELEDLQTSEYDDFTFDQCSQSQITSKEDFSFTFHSIDQPKTEKSRKEKRTKRINNCSTPYSIGEENLIEKKSENETVIVEESRRDQPIIIGYYPVITYQPVCLPPTIYLSKEQIQSQLNDYSRLTKITPVKKN